jgi:hypothetical protein
MPVTTVSSGYCHSRFHQDLVAAWIRKSLPYVHVC